MLGAIIGDIAQAIWEIPDNIKAKALAYLPQDMIAVLNQFSEER